MTSTNRVVANALMSLEEILKKQGLSRAEFDKMMKEMKDKGASAVHYMRGKDGRLLFKADGTTIGNAISEKAVNGAEAKGDMIMAELKVGDEIKLSKSHPRHPGKKGKVVQVFPTGFVKVRLESGEDDIELKRNIATNAKFKVGDKVQRGNQIGVVKDIEKEPYIEVKFKDEPITLFVHERELKISNSSATNAKFKVGDKVRIIGGGVETIESVHPKGRGTGFGPREIDYYATREGGGFITDEDISGVVSSSARNAITGRLPNGMQANDAAAELDRYANRLVQESDKYSFGKHSRRGVSALVDRRTGAVIEIRVHVQTGGAYSQMKDKIDSELKAIGRKFGATDTNAHYWKGDTELTLKFPTTNSRACNSTNAIVRKAMNATALNFSPGDKVSIVDTDIRYGGDKGEVVRKDGFRYVVRLTSRSDKPEVTLQPNQLKAANAVAKNAAWSAERVEPGNEKELLSFHAEAFAKNPTQDRFERLARIIEGEASKGLLAKYYAPGNATSELMAAIREGREQVIGGKGSEVAKKIVGIVEGLRRIGTNSTNPVVANAMRETLNWSAFGGADGQVVTMPIPKSEYGKSDLDFLVEWARKNSADLAKYYTPSNVASKVIALAEKAKRKIDDTTKRRQSEADAKFGTGIGRVNVPETPLKKTEPEIAEIRSVLAGIKQIPSASKEAQKRDAAMERRQKAETQRYYDTHQGARD